MENPFEVLKANTPSNHQLVMTGNGDQSAWLESTNANSTAANRTMHSLGLDNFQLESRMYPRLPSMLLPRHFNLGIARESLLRTVDQTPSFKFSAFQSNMTRFEERAKRDHLSNNEIQSTYEAVEQLLKASTGAVSVDNMRLLASQIMEEAANPNKARTGFSTGSCGPVALESLIYRDNPSLAAKYILQAAMTGHVQTFAGDVNVQADCRPTYESQHQLPLSQNYSSQIFQSIAMNAGLTEVDDNRTFHLQYGKLSNANGAYYVDTQGIRTPFDGATSQMMVDSYLALTGRNDLTVIVNEEGVSTENIRCVNTPDEVQHEIQNAAAHHSPTIVCVDVRNQPFWTQSNGRLAGPTNPHWGYGHCISVNGYDSSTNEIAFHNGWDDSDHNISTTDLFRSMRRVDANLPDMGREFEQSLRLRHGDYANALEGLRIRSETQRISDSDLNRLFNRDIAGLIAQRGDHFLDNVTTRNTVYELLEYFLRNDPRTFTLDPSVRHLFNNWFKEHPND